MLFKIIGDKGSIWYYDNQINQVYDILKNPINLATLDTALPFIAPRPTYNGRAYVWAKFDPRKKYPIQYTKSKNVKIQLGLNCNYHCIYCSQGPLWKKLAQRTQKLNNLFARLRECKVDWSSIRAIEFWGGEPLVYWKTIKQIVDFFDHETNFKGLFHITTNAALFTKEVLDFCRQHRFDILFSHDGVNHKVFRSKNDWLDDPEIVANVKQWFSEFPRQARIGLVYAPFGDLDIQKSYELFYQKIGPIDIMSHSGLRCEQSSKHLLSLYSKENHNHARDNLVNLLTLPRGHKYFEMNRGNHQHSLNDIFAFVQQRLPASYDSKCPTLNKHVLAFNTNGDIITCHQNTTGNQSFGTIDKVEEAYITNLNSGVHFHRKCTECPYIMGCGGPCPLYDNDNMEIECKSTRWRVEACFHEVWLTLFKEKPVRIEKCKDQ